MQIGNVQSTHTHKDTRANNILVCVCARALTILGPQTAYVAHISDVIFVCMIKYVISPITTTTLMSLCEPDRFQTWLSLENVEIRDI